MKVHFKLGRLGRLKRKGKIEKNENWSKPRASSEFYCGCRAKMALAHHDSSNSLGSLQNGIYTAEEALFYDFDSLHRAESWTLQSPEVPFRREFVDPLVPKTDLLVCGVVDKDAIRFAVNLLNPLGDICLHFNPRFDQNYVARNSRIGGSWGTEEAQASSRNPFQRAAQFTLELFVTRYEFLVSVNGKHFCTFTHRVSLSEIKTIEIDGDLKLSKVELNTKDQYPSIADIPSISSPIDKLSLQETPLMRTLDEVVKPGTQLEIRGRVKLLPWSFYINIQDSTNYWPHPQIGYHLRVRMNDSNPGVAFNSWEDNCWGKEESVALSRRFTPGKEFVLLVSCTRAAFVASVDGRHLHDFRYRAHNNSLRLNTLYVHGDIVVSSLALLHS